jgi:hypothetical protein
MRSAGRAFVMTTSAMVVVPAAPSRHSECEGFPFERCLEGRPHRRVVAAIDLGALVDRQGVRNAGHAGVNDQHRR